MSFCSIIHLLRTLFLMPKSHIPYPLPQHYSYGWAPGRFLRKLLPPDRHVLFSPHRLKWQKANTYNVEQFEKVMNGPVTEQQSFDGKDSVSQDSENGTSRLWNDHICTHTVIKDILLKTFFAYGFNIYFNNKEFLYCKMFYKGHIRFHVILHVFSGEFQELCVFLVLSVAPAVAFHNATEALLLHWNAQPHPQQAGPKWPQPW